MNSYNREPLVEKVNNKNYVSDFNYALQYTRWFLSALGIWPCVISKPTRRERFVSILTLPFCFIIMLMITIPTASHITLRDVDRSEFIILLAPLGLQITNILKYVALVLRSGSIKLSIEHMETDWRKLENKNDRDIMMKSLSVGHGFTMICTICMYSSAFFYHAIMPFFSEKVINEFNETVKPLIYPGADIYLDTQVNVIYIIVFSGICISAFYHFTLLNAIFNLASILVSHACGQIQIIISRLSNIVHSREEENNITKIGARMALIIRCHVRVLRFASIINDVLSEMCFLEVLDSTVVICLLEYYCLTEWNDGDRVAMITYVLLFFSLAFNILVFCHIGELLKDQCGQVGRAAYMIEWYKLPGKTGLALIMIIAMANCPRKLTPGGIIELSIATFGNIMRTTLAYLNMLRAVTQ